MKWQSAIFENGGRTDEIGKRRKVKDVGKGNERVNHLSLSNRKNHLREQEGMEMCRAKGRVHRPD